MGFANERGAFLPEDFDIFFRDRTGSVQGLISGAIAAGTFDCGLVHNCLPISRKRFNSRSIHILYMTSVEVKHSIEIAFEVNERSLDERYGFAETRRDRA